MEAVYKRTSIPLHDSRQRFQTDEHILRMLALESALFWTTHTEGSPPSPVTPSLSCSSSPSKAHLSQIQARGQCLLKLICTIYLQQRMHTVHKDEVHILRCTGPQWFQLNGWISGDYTCSSVLCHPELRVLSL